MKTLEFILIAAGVIYLLHQMGILLMKKGVKAYELDDHLELHEQHRKRYWNNVINGYNRTKPQVSSGIEGPRDPA